MVQSLGLMRIMRDVPLCILASGKSVINRSWADDFNAAMQTTAEEAGRSASPASWMAANERNIYFHTENGVRLALVAFLGSPRCFFRDRHSP